MVITVRIRLFWIKYLGEFFEVYGGIKIASKNAENKARIVLELLASKGSLSGDDIASQCTFESRMAAAGTIASLRRQKAIELLPATYRISDLGKSLLSLSQEPAPEKETEAKRKRRAKQEQGQGANP